MITIILPVSRDSFLKAVFERLEMLDCAGEEVGIFIYLDGDLQLFEIAQRLMVASKFTQREIHYRRKGLPNASHVLNRRRRIAEIHNEIKELIPASDYVFLLEDDTLIESDALSKLLYIHKHYSNVGFASGIQIGRWGFNHIGAWLADGRSITSVPMRGNGIMQVEAAGLYCCLIRTLVYRNHTFSPYEKILGPDFNFGLSLKEQGYLNLIDYSVQCKHLTKRGFIDFENTKVIQVGFVKDEENQWALRGQL